MKILFHPTQEIRLDWSLQQKLSYVHSFYTAVKYKTTSKILASKREKEEITAKSMWQISCDFLCERRMRREGGGREQDVKLSVDKRFVAIFQTISKIDTNLYKRTNTFFIHAKRLLSFHPFLALSFSMYMFQRYCYRWLAIYLAYFSIRSQCHEWRKESEEKYFTHISIWVVCDINPISLFYTTYTHLTLWNWMREMTRNLSWNKFGYGLYVRLLRWWYDGFSF